MNDYEITGVPAVLDAIRRDTQRIGFTMASELQTGALLRTLAASKHGGQFLELGTGTGVGTAWLHAGMDADSRLGGERLKRVAGRSEPSRARPTREISPCRRCGVPRPGPCSFSTPKRRHLLCRRPSAACKVPALIADLESRRGFVATKLAWASGLYLNWRDERCGFALS